MTRGEESMFSIHKALSVVSQILHCTNGVMTHLRLLKLIYIVEREALNSLGYSITGDRIFSWKGGLVPEVIHKLILGEGGRYQFLWDWYIGAGRVIQFRRGFDEELLSRRERSVIKVVCKRYGALTRKELTLRMYKYPEWELATQYPHQIVDIKTLPVSTCKPVLSVGRKHHIRYTGKPLKVTPTSFRESLLILFKHWALRAITSSDICELNQHKEDIV